MCCMYVYRMKHLKMVRGFNFKIFFNFKKFLTMPSINPEASEIEAKRNNYSFARMYYIFEKKLRKLETSSA